MVLGDLTALGLPICTLNSTGTILSAVGSLNAGVGMWGPECLSQKHS